MTASIASGGGIEIEVATHRTLLLCRRFRHTPAAGQLRGEADRDDRQCEHGSHHHIHLWQLLTEADGAEDPDRQRRLGARRERGHDHLVEGEGETLESPPETSAVAIVGKVT